MKSKLLLIGMFALLMLGAVYIVGTTLREEGKVNETSTLSTDLTPSIPTERNMFLRAEGALAFQNMPESQKSLDKYYENRAYPGAPPSIPHALLSEKGIGGKTCLQCHQNGGYVDQFKAFASITPHPQLLNCKQCHLPKKTSLVFKDTDWEKIQASPIHQAAMPGAPPIIPHELSMRSNCLSCHAGPAAPIEIRVSHPERVNCRQCHLPKNTEEFFRKPVFEQNTFIRPDSTISLNQKQLNEEEVARISAWIRNENH